MQSDAELEMHGLEYAETNGLIRTFYWSTCALIGYLRRGQAAINEGAGSVILCASAASA